MDALSDVLKSVRLDGAVYLLAEFTAPWCMRARYGLVSLHRPLRPGEHVVYFHYVMDGACRVRLDEGGASLAAHAGDIVMFPRDDHHRVASDMQLAPVEGDAVVSQIDPADPGLIRMRYGGGGEATRFVCSYLIGQRAMLRPLVDALPPMLVIRLGDDPAATFVRELLNAGVRESASAMPGGESTRAKVAELLFVEAMRRHVDALPKGGAGWFAGLRDPQVGRALSAIHGRPSHAWTVDTLAAEAALSRSAFAERFAELAGDPPMQYLTRWRLALAAQALRAGDEAISRIAERAGYDSDAAFSRAFRREHGVPPATWRREASGGTR
ncbi:MAG TPA: AraC family transcriptional regulator [Casimicrobiaceae bacterium]|mgnify:CR=1 FL=1|nr:AraC family transcriptional regulator [Casimicrobiaceae bacterium]